MKVTDKIEITNEDNMALMSRYEDNYFDLAIVDPPYGIGWDGDNLESYNSTSCESWKGRKPKGYNKKNWDSETPKKEYFDQLKRVSKNQIIWGGNYFNLKPTGGWIVWDKGVVMPTFSDGEMAWQSLTNSMKIIKMLWAGYRKCEETNRIHPTQKPVKLYEWLLMNYAKQGDKILDTHLGSGSIAMASHNLGYELTACELDKEYYDASLKRIKDHISQQRLF